MKMCYNVLMAEKIFRKIHYPKLLLFALCVLAAYVLFQNHSFEFIAEKLNHHGYVAIFIAGCLFSYGFTAPFAIAIFIALAEQVQVGIAAPLAAVGALISDFLIFSWVRFSMEDEFEELSLTRPIRWLKGHIQRHLGPKLQKYLGWAMAGIIIGSPLPDEIGVSLLSGFGEMDKRLFAIIDYTCNMLGIATILILA